MLALVHGVERFHTYLYGRAFTIHSDHKPLEVICGKPISAAPPRLQRMLLKIQDYDYTVKYIPGAQMVISDTLSRLPNPMANEAVDLDIRVDDIELDLINFSPAKQEQLRTETRKCAVMNALSEVIYQGWPENIKQLPSAIQPFWSYRDTLGIEDGIIFKGRQVLIPHAIQEDILQQLHEGHQGVEKTRLLARDSVYWPRINEDIANMVKSCKACCEHQEANRKEPLMPSETPSAPWKVIATDIFEIKGKYFTIVSDCYSKYPMVREMPGLVTSTAVTKFIEELCAMFGIPDIIRSDNGPQYSGEAFKKFCREWDIQHVTSSPHYPQSNGYIERQIRWIKPIIKKCLNTGENVNRALLTIRATPTDNTIPSPAELLMKRRISTPLPFRSENHAGGEIKAKMEEKKHVMKEYHDQKARKVDLPPLHRGQSIRILDRPSRTWCPGTVMEKCSEPRSYIVETPLGTQVRRNRSQLREMSSKPQPAQTCATPMPQPDSAASQPPDNCQPTEAVPPQDVACSPKPATGARTSRSGRVIRAPDRYRNN